MKRLIIVGSIVTFVGCGGNEVTGPSVGEKNITPNDSTVYSNTLESSSTVSNNTVSNTKVISTDRPHVCDMKASIIIPGTLVRSSGFWAPPNNAIGFLTKVGTTDRRIKVTSPFSNVDINVTGSTNKYHLIRLDVYKKDMVLVCSKTVLATQ